MPGLEDPNFNHGVTLLCQHNEEGALGITVNRLSEFLLEDVFEQLDIPCEDPALGAIPVYSGGPVHPERGFVLHTADRQWENTVSVGSGILVTTSRDVLESIARGEGPEKFLVALGYAGWGSGQLEDEMRDNAWLNVMASADILFDHPPDDRWEQAVASLGIDIANLQPVGGHA
ncbi:YqgE/AlgH family protein [Wenzhouxiangella sp. AB-CW3]|uniref:YqgE/AlgH family protein n=1 Tax=Wenzhouxiangella sp. AB-CW3 TaxID=2771012 RepID=UPI00168AC15D|nr:YqgE/AlgH family protein [Wenzhouxiangella sp. AB-CW3]QOC24136.1 YqgE/AlgH family protein [Wenzhouxiangella sp. AB-CW3]